MITLHSSTIVTLALWVAGCLVLTHRLYAEVSARREGEAVLRGARLARAGTTQR